MGNAYICSDIVAARLACVQSLFIDGTWSEAADGSRSDVFDPSSGEVITSAAVASREDTERAIAAARSSFDAGDWNGLTPAARGKILWRVADLLEAHGDEMAELEMLDAGKFFAATRNGEVPFAAECFRYYAGWCTKIEGSTQQISTVPGQAFHSYTRREAIGVAALIVPWNGPLVQAAGVPDGVFNLLLGGGATLGQWLAQHPDIDKVSFTGSTAVGKKIISAARGNLKKVSLELGGKSPVIVFADADLEQAIAGVAQGIFANAGQVCVAGSRLYVQESVYEQVVEGIAEIARNMSVGPATTDGLDMGPLISKRQLKSVHAMIESGKAAGARVVAGGELIEGQGGYFLQPTVFADTDHSMDIVREEIFGPVLVAMPFRDGDDIVAIANDNQYGLAASIWTRDISKAHKTAASIQAGILWINCHGIPDMAVPFGGYKQSGWGRENGYEALLQYTELKSVIVKL